MSPSPDEAPAPEARAHASEGAPEARAHASEGAPEARARASRGAPEPRARADGGRRGAAPGSTAQATAGGHGPALAPAGDAHGEPPHELFAALADSTRRTILRVVAEDGSLTATALADRLPVSRQAITKHLGVLRAAGLVTAERSGRETRFTAATQPLDELATWAESAGRRWDDRLARLKDRFG